MYTHVRYKDGSTTAQTLAPASPELEADVVDAVGGHRQHQQHEHVPQDDGGGDGRGRVDGADGKVDGAGQEVRQDEEGELVAVHGVQYL